MVQKISAGLDIQLSSPRKRLISGGNRYVLSLLQKVLREVQLRRENDSEFHMVGAAKANERLPNEVRRSGTCRRQQSDERRLRAGVYQEISSAR